ncbi:MAG TPA: hypothetical protein PKW44_04325 [Methylophilaceae bacterium]|nr:hypothetical protein [Methylophilaceae bacterium]HQR60209.1 hypothetical protein [Methylophilaceae bacterium]
MIHHITDVPGNDTSRIVERPDGFYWIDYETEVEFGPFATAALAIADMTPALESSYEPGETLQEAEAELGICDWIDPETGAPAEDSVHRLED